MFGLGLPELFLILVVVVVIFGPRRLPQLGQAIGASIRGFKRSSTGDDPPAISDTGNGKSANDGLPEDPGTGDAKGPFRAHV